MLATALLPLALAMQTTAAVGGRPVDQSSQQVAAADDQEQKEKEPPTPEHTGIHALLGNLGEDVKKLPAMQNLYLAAIGGGVALAVHPADQTFNAHLQAPYSPAVNAFFAPGKYLGDTPEQLALSLGTYAFARIFDQPKTAHLAMDLLQAQAITEMLVEPLKFATRRERPDGSNNQSFPSGHAAITFAGATVIERHLGWKYSLIGYGVATYVAASRLHDNRHYLSDVAFGAAVGSIAGRTVVHHASDYWALTPVRVPGGVALLVMRAAPPK
ncbi:MAG TPA: phosphatase PAP2 family protein [Vicinamibacterales bacterium]|nr:phosphatase PAP2 family protein [Vicinamibacterales bacterium]